MLSNQRYQNEYKVETGLTWKDGGMSIIFVRLDL